MASISDFIKIVDKFQGKDYASLYRDFVVLTRIECTIANKIDDELKKNTLAQYSEAEHELFRELFVLFLALHKDKVQQQGWSDTLGIIYEEFQTKWKSKGLGQYFTPEALCTISAKLQNFDRAGVAINDCASGSSRMLLACHAEFVEKFPKDYCDNFYVGQDIDVVSVEMSALNFALHGMRGSVVHQDTLENKWFGQFDINRWPAIYNGLPHIVRVEHQVNAHLFRDDWNRLNIYKYPKSQEVVLTSTQ